MTVRIDVRIPNWIGDAIMAAPAIRALGALEADVECHLWGIPRTLPLFEGLDAPFHLHPLPPRFRRPASLARVVGAVRANRASAALVLPPSFSSALVHAAAGTRRRFGWPGEGRSALLTDLGPRARRDLHLRAQYEELARIVSRELFGEELPRAAGGPRLPLRASEIVAAKRRAAQVGIGARTLALAPGATYGATKRWPEARFLALGRRWIESGGDLLWFGGPGERDLCRRLAESAGPKARSRSLAGALTLRESLALLAEAALLVSNDSGAMHMAQASGTPVVGLFGSTSPAWTGPVGPSARVVYRGIPCSPCFARTCPTQIECLGEISVDEAWDAVRDLAVRARGALRPAVFLDRDGTLLELVPYLKSADDVRLVPGTGEALRTLAAAGFALVVVTNQSVVARGEASLAEVQAVHRRMEELLASEGVRLDAIEVCPHHPDFTGPCACRKPEPGMLWRAAQSLGLDLGRSWFLGDHEGDCEAARRAGVRFALVRTGYGREFERELAGAADPVSVFDDVKTASQAILASLEALAQE